MQLAPPSSRACIFCQLASTVQRPAFRSVAASRGSQSRTYKRPSMAPKPVPDFKHIAQNPGLYEQNCMVRNYPNQAQNAWLISTLRSQIANVQKQVELMSVANNQLQDEFKRDAERKTQSQGQEGPEAEESPPRQGILEEARAVKAALARYKEEQHRNEAQMMQLALELPNLTSRHTPTAHGQKPVELERYEAPGVDRGKDVVAKSHTDIGAELDLLDFTGAAKSSGWGWYFLKNEAALLEQALIQYTLSILSKRGYQIVSPPSIVYSHIVAACGFQPRDENDEQQIYNLVQPEKDEDNDFLAQPEKDENNDNLAQPERVEDSHNLAQKDKDNDNLVQSEKDKGNDNEKPQLSLAGTAEIPLAAMKTRVQLKEDSLPLKVAGVSRCFRAEAGARGVDTKGLYRVHEFTKVEMFAWTAPDTEASETGTGFFKKASKDGRPSQSDVVFNEMIAIQKEILESLGLTYRVLEMPAPELGATASRKQDIEVFFPSRQTHKDRGWGEVTSTSACTDYQTRRLATRMRRRDGRLDWPYTLNGTALAVPRILAALLECGYDHGRDGAVKIPECLRMWMGGMEYIERRK